MQPGSIVEGQRETGIEDLTRDSAALMADVRKAVATVNTTLERLDKTALSEESLQDLRQTLANLKKGSEGFANIDQTSKDLQAAAADARQLMASARSGSGPLPMMLNDRQAATDLKTLIANLRRHGVLWYKDSQKPAR